MPSLLRVEGSWPGSLTVRAGWFRARARPWNEVISDPMLRLDRGGTEFLIAAVRRLGDLGVEAVFSPALYPGSSGVWRRSGFEDYARLDVMERAVDTGTSDNIREDVRRDPDPDWDRVLDVDRSAFEGFWGMSRLGLEEAVNVSRSNAVLVSGSNDNLSGYAIVGSQWGTVYLHRIAVRPEDSGHGVGSALLNAAIAWGRRSGARSIVLNVRPDNERAKGFYARHGFIETHTALEVLRHDRS
ncbi:MAG: GNAT family N-acetyltransferase [Actinomycetota bacterium]